MENEAGNAMIALLEIFPIVALAMVILTVIMIIFPANNSKEEDTEDPFVLDIDTEKEIAKIRKLQGK